MPLYEFRCEKCGLFEEWRTIAEVSNPIICPACQRVAKRIFSPPGVMLSSSLRLRQENPQPQIIKRHQEQEKIVPKYRSHNNGRPWMISH